MYFSSKVVVQYFCGISVSQCQRVHKGECDISESECVVALWDRLVFLQM